MNRRQAAKLALAKRVLAWVIFIPALISTAISLLKYLSSAEQTSQAFSNILLDFAHAIVELLRENTPFLELFWRFSPRPDFHGQLNIGFWIIYALIFIAMALHAASLRLNRRVRYLREKLEDQLIIEQATGDTRLSREQLEASLKVPDNSLFRQYFTLYIAPFIFIAIGYIGLKLLHLT